MRNLPIQKAANSLTSNKWVIVYESRYIKQADQLLQTLQQASVKLGIQVEDPSWIEVPRMDDTQAFHVQLKNLINQNLKPTMVLVMLSNEKLYKAYKNICYNLNLVSQCVKYSNFGKGMNLSVASNVLRQINSKLGGDLYNIKFGKELSPLTMLIGIDVCHSGPNSIVGFCASVNRQRSQYYSERIT